MFPQGFEEINKQKETLPKPKPKKDELSSLKKLNHKLGVYLNPNTTDITENEKRRKIGVVITLIIFTTLIISSYYFIIYEPYQKELSLEKTTKLNELHELYSGALTTSPNAMALENEIENGKSIEEVERINIVSPATKDWKSYHQKSIRSSLDKYNRTMAVYSNESKNIIMSEEDALKIVNGNDAKIYLFQKKNGILQIIEIELKIFLMSKIKRKIITKVWNGMKNGMKVKMRNIVLNGENLEKKNGKKNGKKLIMH